MAIVTSDAVILRKLDLRETSLLVNLFTKECGKITGVLKGVRSPQPQFGSGYELFSVVKVVFYERRNKDIYLVSQCDLLEYFSNMRKDLGAIGLASYFAELVDYSCQALERHDNVYDLLVRSYGMLSAECALGRIKRSFEIKILKELGLQPGLSGCAGCKAEIPKDILFFSVNRGGLVCEECIDRFSGAVKVSEAAVNGMRKLANASLDEAGECRLGLAVETEIDGILKNFINFHIQKRFKSVEFIEQITDD